MVKRMDYWMNRQSFSTHKLSLKEQSSKYVKMNSLFQLHPLETYKGDSISDIWQCFTLSPSFPILNHTCCLSFCYQFPSNHEISVPSLLVLPPSFYSCIPPSLQFSIIKKIKIKLAIAGLSILDGVKEKEIEIL